MCFCWTEYWHSMFSSQLCGLIYYAQFACVCVSWKSFDAACKTATMTMMFKPDRKRLRRNNSQRSQALRSLLSAVKFIRERRRERMLSSTIVPLLYVQN